MVCHACGTRNLPDAPFCSRCGARIAPADEQVASQPTSPGALAEIQAQKARECLESGDVKCALDMARSATMAHPSVPLTHVVLGEAYLAIDAPDDALREFRAAIELDPDQPDVREKAELARRRIARPTGEASESGLDAFLKKHGRLMPVFTGLAAALLVFTIGAAAIAVRTSPRAQRERAFKQQMRLASEYYAAGRFPEAAEAFGRAAQISPSSAEAKRRAVDAWTMAGGNQRIAQAAAGAAAPTGPVVTFSGPIGSPRWVGPPPNSGTSQQGVSRPPRGGPVAPPPVVPDPLRDPTGGVMPGPLPPPPEAGPPSTTAVTGTSRLDIPPGPGAPGYIGAPVTPEAGVDDDPEPAPPPARQGGHISVEVLPPRPATEKPAEASAPSADALRAEARRLKASGRLSEAATKFTEAGAQYRSEAQTGGPDASAKQQAARSCDLAREACESQ